MASSTCPKCGNHSFELVEHEPTRSAWKYNYLQCASCGAVVGLTDFFNLGHMLELQAIAIKKIASKLGVHVEL